MQVTQVRNATLLIHYAGTRFLMNPMLSAKGSLPGFEGTANSQLRNPLVELPLPMTEILDVDAVIVTHNHLDHWDPALLPKHLPLFVQHQKDADSISASGFKDVRLLSEQAEFAGIRLHQTEGQHGDDQVMAVLAERLGEVSGVVFSIPQRRPSIWRATPSGTPRLNRRCNGTSPRSSSSTAAMPRCRGWVPSSWARRMSPPCIRQRHRPP